MKRFNRICPACHQKVFGRFMIHLDFWHSEFKEEWWAE